MIIRPVKVWAFKNEKQSFLGCREAAKLLLFPFKRLISPPKTHTTLSFPATGSHAAVGRGRSCESIGRKRLFCPTANDRTRAVISCSISKNSTFSFRREQELFIGTLLLFLRSEMTPQPLFKGGVSRYSVIFCASFARAKNGGCSRKCRGHQIRKAWPSARGMAAWPPALRWLLT